MSAGAIQYPVPQRLLIAGLMNYVYEGPFTQLVTVKLPAGLAVGTQLPLSVKLDYLVCTREICVPESQTLATTLTVGDGAVDAATRAKFDGWRRLIPKPLGSTATFAIADGKFRLTVPFPADARADGVYFYPLATGAADFAAPQKVSRDGDTLTVETKAATRQAVGSRRRAVGRRRAGVRNSARCRARSVPRRSVAMTALVAFLGAVLGRVAAQRHAVRVPDPEPEGAEPGAVGASRRRMRGARRWPIARA